MITEHTNTEDTQDEVLQLTEPEKIEELGTINVRKIPKEFIDDLATIGKYLFGINSAEATTKFAIAMFVEIYMPTLANKINTKAASLPYRKVIDVIDEKNKDCNTKLEDIKKLCLKTKKDKAKANNKNK